MPSVAIIGFGYLGKAYAKVFPDAVIYDEPQELLQVDDGVYRQWDVEESRKIVNECDIAIVAVPTDPLPDGSLDMSIIEDVVGWLETDLILIKSALNIGTVDKLVEETGKRIAVSVEMIGMGNYSMPFWKYPHPTDPSMHQMLIIGGEEETAKRCANVLWSKMAPSIDIHLVSAKEAEICKLWENWWGSLKVTMSNLIYDLCEASGANYTKVLQAWGSDGRVEKMHCRVVPGKRGFKSHCYQKDIPALASNASKLGVENLSDFINMQMKINEEHLETNEKS